MDETATARWYSDLMTLCGRVVSLILRGAFTKDQRVSVANALVALADRVAAGD